VPEQRRVEIFAWYNLIGSVATAFGALCGGGVTQLVLWLGVGGPGRYRPLVIGDGLAGLLVTYACIRLSSAVEGGPVTVAAVTSAMGPLRARIGLHRSFPVVLKLSGLFALDALGGGFVIQSIVAYWFYLRFAVDPATIGGIFFGANMLAGASA